ncbi:hypothetical protein DFJ73DRAFT_917812 [Zopfochytrium polystomum]|nr:hypothetical protein DFJ73DRAFT_917812 [Zopfochytrium polystomum]
MLPSVVAVISVSNLYAYFCEIGDPLPSDFASAASIVAGACATEPLSGPEAGVIGSDGKEERMASGCSGRSSFAIPSKRLAHLKEVMLGSRPRVAVAVIKTTRLSLNLSFAEPQVDALSRFSGLVHRVNRVRLWQGAAAAEGAVPGAAEALAELLDSFTVAYADVFRLHAVLSGLILVATMFVRRWQGAVVE